MANEILQCSAPMPQLEACRSSHCWVQGMSSLAVHHVLQEDAL